MPSPENIVSIERLEADANAFPNDPAKQLALYQGLLRLNVKEGTNRVLSRWERTCQFVGSFRYDGAFQGF